jgi:ABC-type sugar transport system permease subunit
VTVEDVFTASTAGTSTMATYMVGIGRNGGQYGYGDAVAVVLFGVSPSPGWEYPEPGRR